MIERLNWDMIVRAPDDAEPVTPEQWLAIWPSPVLDDACFARAGFTQFADTDESWDHEWRAVVTKVISDLTFYGLPSIRHPIVPVTENRLLDRILHGAPKYREIRLSLEDQVLLATEDDRIPPAIVDFGVRPSITLVASEGHPLLWLRFDSSMNPYAQERNNGIWYQYQFSRFNLGGNVLGPPVVPTEPFDAVEDAS